MWCSGWGSPTAEVLLVGEAPGASEDQQGEPFVGAAGKLLDDMLAHDRPAAAGNLHHQQRQVPPAQKPGPSEHRKGRLQPDYLRRQLELMQPKILVCLGRISAAEIIRPDFKITQEHGQFF